MDEFLDSDCNNLTMLATKSFDDILEQVRASSLNFQIQISPFSAIISLKKSLTKDKSGNPIAPKKLVNLSSHQIEALAVKNLELERKLSTLQNDHTVLFNECTEAYETINKLEKSLDQNSKIKLETDTIEHARAFKAETRVS